MPVNDTVCGLPGALSAIDKDAVRIPLTLGVNVTLIVQVAPAATLDPQWRYQKLLAEVRPFLGDDDAAQESALRRGTLAQWAQTLDDFDEFRFARLTALLRQRDPDDNVNYSILVYRLTAADLARAVDGPPPPYGPDVLRELEVGIHR